MSCTTPSVDQFCPFFDEQRGEIKPYRTQFDAGMRTWSGRKAPPAYKENVTVAQVLMESLHRRPDHIGQISVDMTDGGSTLKQQTNDELRLHAIRVGQHLGRMGIRSGDVIGIVARNHPDLAAVVLGCMALDAPVHTLDDQLETDEIERKFRLSQPKIVFCEADNFESVRQALHNLSLDVACFAFGDRVEGARSVDNLLVTTNAEYQFIPVKLVDGRKQMAAIVCAPAGPSKNDTSSLLDYCISHSSLLEQMSKAFPATRDDVALTFSGVHTIAGMAMLIGGMLRALTRIISTQPFDAKTMLHLVAEHKITYFVATPVQLDQIIQRSAFASVDLTSLKHFYVDGGGSPLTITADQSDRIERYLPAGIRQMYSQNEVVGVVAAATNCSRLEADVTPATVGQLAHGMLVQIRDADYRRCNVNEDGEICVGIVPLFLGYLGNAELTAELIDADGWMRTGDIGHIDATGNLSVVDRKKDMLSYCANN